MFWVSMSISVLLSVGVILLFNINKTALRDFFYVTKKSTAEKISKRSRTRKISLKKQVEALLGNKKTNFIARNFGEAVSILEENHESHRIKGIYILSALCGLFGFVISLITNNMFLVPVLTVGAALVPVWIVKLTASGKKKRLSNELEIVLSGVTTSYIRSDNIITAVEENLPYMSGLPKFAFTKFVNESKMINANITLGLQKLQRSIEDTTFQEWCDALYQCQSDRSIKVTLLPIVNKFSETKAIQQELDTMMMIPFKDTITIVIIVLFSIPLMYLINQEWYAVLTTTPIGQLIIALVFVAIIYAINKSIALSAPIKHGED